MSSSSRFSLVVTTLTPLHVGSGQRLREGYDFIAHDRRLWIANQALIYDAMLDEALLPAPAQEAAVGAMAAALAKAGLATAAHAPAGRDPAQAAADMARMTLADYKSKGWLRPEHFLPERGLFRYSLAGQTSTTGKEGELHEQIKDVLSRPYLPGSSLKGALRSVVLRTLAAGDAARPPVIAHADRRYAARDMEQRHFAPASPAPRSNSNYDVWRSVHISDCTPFDQAALGIAQVYVRRFQARTAPAGSGDIPIDVEAVRPQSSATAVLTLDPWLFDDPRADRLMRFPAELRAMLMQNLCTTAHADALQLLDDELAFFAAVAPGSVHIISTLQQMRSVVANAAPNEMFVRCGRSTGWRSKTLGRVLDERLTAGDFDNMVRDFDLGRKTWRQGRPLPRTRQLATMANEKDVPMGWLRIVLEEEP